MSRIRFPSFAKINWYLKILGRRGDGYHELLTLLQTIDLRDEITLDTLSHSAIELRLTGRQVATGEENLVFRSAQLLQRKCRISQGVRIHLDKRIPVGAGLGGGSANAASMLIFLNQLWGCHCTLAELEECSAQLGSDVPFFLVGGLAAAQGRGERLTPLPDTPVHSLLLYYPGFEISAAEAYELGKWPPLATAPMLTKTEVDNTILRFRSEVGRGVGVADLAENDFDGPLYAHVPPLARARNVMLEAGCQRVILCGSGSTLLGIAPSDQIDQVKGALSSRGSGEVITCRTVSRSQYWGFFGEAGLKPSNSYR